MTKILAGIVAYNTSLETLEQTLKSFKNSRTAVHCVVLCNSKDPQYQVSVAKLCDELSITIIPNAPNNGFGAGHNQIFHTYGQDQEWYICSNPDVVLREDTIENLLKASTHHRQAVQLAPKILNKDLTTQKLSRKFLNLGDWLKRQFSRLKSGIFRLPEENFNYEQSQKVEFVSGCFFAISSMNYQKLGGFSSDYFLYCEDADLSIRASRLGYNFFVHDAIIIHEWQMEWSKSRSALKNQISSLIVYFKKFGFFPKL